jgi:hypothetical protein
MLSVEPVTSKKELLAFIKFPMDLYRGNSFHVPPIVDFELSTLDQKKNPAFDHCKASYWLVKKEGKIVGRIAGIIHDKELAEKGKARFGWIDFIDDQKVVDLLFETVKQWSEEQHASELHGPLGFTDLDFEGALVSVYDQMATQATIYNHPYYISHYERCGFTKAVDWVEVRSYVPKEVPRKIARSASLASNRFGLKIKEFKRAKDTLKYAEGVFKVLNEAYSDLYGYYELTEKQIKYYVDQYFGFIRKEYVSIVVNDKDEVVAVAISLPTLSRAFQKSKGSFFPFGFFHILKAFYSNKHLDLFLIGASPDYQKLGASAVIFNALLTTYIKKGVEYISTGPMLATNRAVLNQWAEFSEHLHDVNIRRRCYTKSLINE